MQSKHKDYIALFGIAALWALIEFIIKPFGNFAINDDFFYSTPLKALVEHGEWVPVQIASPNAFSQILWASIFCLPFGFSFTAAKISTLALAIAGTFLTYLFLRRINASKLICFFAVCLLILNPFFLPLSNSFMTDIPFYTLFLISSYFFIKALETRKFYWILFATVFSLLAALNRQFGIVIPLAYAITAITLTKYSFKKASLTFLPLFATGAALLGYAAWITDYGSTPEPLITKLSNTPDVLSRGPVHIFSRISYVAISSCVYLGLFFSPILCFTIPSLLRPNGSFSRKYLLTYLIFCIMGFIILYQAGHLMPLLPNNIVDFGIGPGPALMRNGGSFWPKAPPALWQAMTLAGLFFAAAIVQLIIYAIRQCLSGSSGYFKLSREKLYFLLVFCLFYLPLISIIGPFDRYIVPFYLIILTLLLSFERKIKTGYVPAIFGTLCFSLLAYFTVAGSHDLFALYRTKEQAINNLLLSGKGSKSNIDGGLEFNGWPTNWEVQKRTNSSSWWNVLDDQYVVTTGRLDGYEVLETLEFYRWMFLDTGRIYILEKRRP